MHDSSAPSWLILAESRCSEQLRELSETQHWPVLESIDEHKAARAVVAMGAEYVAVEASAATSRLPGLARLLASLDTTESVVCIAQALNAAMERDAASCGILLCDSVERFADHLGLLHPLPLPASPESPVAMPARDASALN